MLVVRFQPALHSSGQPAIDRPVRLFGTPGNHFPSSTASAPSGDPGHPGPASNNNPGGRLRPSAPSWPTDGSGNSGNTRSGNDRGTFPPTPPPPPSGAPTGQTGGRLNLLISCASWRTDSWADAIPPLLEPLGVHSLRARSAREAERTIRQTQVHIAVVDLGLPLDDPSRSSAASSGGGGGVGGESAGGTAEEAGPRILELLRRLESPPPTVVIKGPRTSRDEARHMSAALRCGAFAVVDRTGANLEQMLEILRRALHRFYQDRWPT